MILDGLICHFWSFPSGREDLCFGSRCYGRPDNCSVCFWSPEASRVGKVSRKSNERIQKSDGRVREGFEEEIRKVEERSSYSACGDPNADLPEKVFESLSLPERIGKCRLLKRSPFLRKYNLFRGASFPVPLL